MKSHAGAGTQSMRAATPVHPMFVHFPLALIVFAVASDGAFFFTEIESLRHVGWWSLAAASAAAAVTAAAGIFDMRRANLEEEVHIRVHRHMKVGLALLAAVSALTFWRWRIFMDPAGQVTAVYLDCAVLVMAMALFQGWLGGELVYSHGVFVRQRAKNASPGEPAKGKGGGHHHH